MLILRHLRGGSCKYLTSKHLREGPHSPLIFNRLRGLLSNVNHNPFIILGQFVFDPFGLKGK